MTVADQIKIFDGKIKQNEDQHDLERKAAKISALSSENLDNNEFLTDEGLDFNPSAVEKANLLKRVSSIG